MYMAAIGGRMANSGKVLHGEMAMARESRAFGADSPITPPQTGDEGSKTPLSEYSLHFEMGLLQATMVYRLLCFAPDPSLNCIRPDPQLPGEVDGYPTSLYTLDHETTCGAFSRIRRWFKLLAHFCVIAVWP
jgi:hypothetical protein